MSPYGTSPLTNALVSSKVALTPKSIPDHYEYQLFRLYLSFRDTKYHYLLLFLVRSISSCLPQNIIFLHQYQAYPIHISDVFALAVTLWEIFERNTPFGGMADMIVINQILANVRPKIEKTPSEFRALIQRAWMDNAKARPNAGQIAYVLSNL